MELGIGEIVVILVIVVIFFGPSKLPQLGDALGKSIRNFKKAASEPEPRADMNVFSAPPTLPAASVAIAAPEIQADAHRNQETVQNHGATASAAR